MLYASYGKPSRIYIEQDNKDLTTQNKGADVQFDSSGHSYIEVREPRMYYLVQNPSFGSHMVELIPSRAGNPLSTLSRSEMIARPSSRTCSGNQRNGRSPGAVSGLQCAVRGRRRFASPLRAHFR